MSGSVMRLMRTLALPGVPSLTAVSTWDFRVSMSTEPGLAPLPTRPTHGSCGVVVALVFWFAAGVTVGAGAGAGAGVAGDFVNSDLMAVRLKIFLIAARLPPRARGCAW